MYVFYYLLFNLTFLLQVLYELALSLLMKSIFILVGFRDCHLSFIEVVFAACFINNASL